MYEYMPKDDLAIKYQELLDEEKQLEEKRDELAYTLFRYECAERSYQEMEETKRRNACKKQLGLCKNELKIVKENIEAIRDEFNRRGI